MTARLHASERDRPIDRASIPQGIFACYHCRNGRLEQVQCDGARPDGLFWFDAPRRALMGKWGDHIPAAKRGRGGYDRWTELMCTAGGFNRSEYLLRETWS